MKALLPIPALLFALQANAACYMQRPDTTMPAIPDGAVATEESMLNAQVEVQAYIANIEKFLECRSDLSSLEHNSLVFTVTEAAESYNSSLTEYRAHQEAVAKR